MWKAKLWIRGATVFIFSVPKEYMLINLKKKFYFSIVIHYNDNSNINTTAKN